MRPGHYYIFAANNRDDVLDLIASRPVEDVQGPEEAILAVWPWLDSGERFVVVQYTHDAAYGAVAHAFKVVTKNGGRRLKPVLAGAR